MARAMSADTCGYYTKSIDDVFVQNKKRRIHESMDPKNKTRESRDSEAHPNAFPVILSLDVTGSMGQIPHNLIKDGLPNLMGTVIQQGAKDTALLFIAVGDVECDSAPLQAGQFDSGDKELDLWLTRTWLERGGGGNYGESYHLAYYFAARHTVSDAWEKRNQRGILITIGDEPCLKTISKRAVEEVFGDTVQKSNLTTDEMLAEAQEKYKVFHLHVTHSSGGRESLAGWQKLLGQNCIEVKDYTKIPDVVANLIVQNTPSIDQNEDVITVGIDNNQKSDKVDSVKASKKEEGYEGVEIIL